MMSWWLYNLPFTNMVKYGIMLLYGGRIYDDRQDIKVETR